MEYALEELWKQLSQTMRCLNPCFNGICSRRLQKRRLGGKGNIVLILVLMEYALEAIEHWGEVAAAEYVLILVLMEYALEDRNGFAYISAKLS